MNWLCFRWVLRNSFSHLKEGRLITSWNRGTWRNCQRSVTNGLNFSDSIIIQAECRKSCILMLQIRASWRCVKLRTRSFMIITMTFQSIRMPVQRFVFIRFWIQSLPSWQKKTKSLFTVIFRKVPGQRILSLHFSGWSMLDWYIESPEWQRRLFH